MDNNYIEKINLVMNNRTQEEQVILNKQLFDAIEKNDINKIKIALGNGGQINAKHSPQHNRTGYPLGYAASLGLYESSKYLLECGADVNGLDKTILIFPFIQKNYEMIELMFKYNPIITSRVIGTVVLEQDQKSLELLIDYGIKTEEIVSTMMDCNLLEFKEHIINYSKAKNLHDKLDVEVKDNNNQNKINKLKV